MNSGSATNDRVKYLPVLSLLIAATLWGVIWYPLRLLGDAGLSGLWSTLIIYAVVLVPCLPWLVPHLPIIRKMPGNICLLAIFAGWCNVSFILALLDGNVVRVVLLFYLSPVWTVLLGCFFLDEKLNRRSWLVLGLAMTGSLIILWPDDMSIWSSLDWADLLAISSGMAFAASNVMIRKTGDIPILIKMTATWTGVIIIAISGLVMYQLPLPQVSSNAYLGAAALGWFGIFAMTLTAQYGVTHMPVHRSAVIMLFEVVATAVSAWFLSAQGISLIEWCGGALVIAAACLSALSLREEIAN